MNVSTLIFALLIPILFWAAYHYYHDRHRPEPVANLLLCIVLGAAGAYLNQAMYAGLGVLGLRYDAVALAQENLPGLFAYAVLAIGPAEELAKLLPFLLIVLRFRAFDESGDGIVYASFLALGFSIVENLNYLQFMSPEEGIARGFAAPFVHIVFASIWGYWIGRAHCRGRFVAPAATASFLAAALLHGIYDFIVLGFTRTALVAAAALVMAIWIWRLRLMLSLGRDGADDVNSESVPNPR